MTSIATTSSSSLSDVPKQLRSTAHPYNSLSDHADAVANDVQYHQLCWVYAQREARPTSEHSGEVKQTHRVIADIEV